MDFGLKDKVVMVTGASGTIGRAMAVEFSREGAAVAVCYHGAAEEAEKTVTAARAAGGNAISVRLDLADERSIDEALQDIVARAGDVGVLVNNAVEWPGFPKPGELFETAPTEKFRRSLLVNLEGPYLLSRAVTAAMRAAGWGRIIHISTGLVVDGNPGSASYVCAKAGLHGLARVMSRELAPAGILTNVVMAGFVPGDRKVPEDTVRRAAGASAIRRVTEAAEVARAVVFLGSAANTNITGELIRVDGHFLAPI